MRDWSLIMGRARDYKTGGGRGASEDLPIQKKKGGGGSEKVLAMLNTGA